MDELKQMLIDSPRMAVDVELDGPTDVDADRETRPQEGKQHCFLLSASSEQNEWLGDPKEVASRRATFGPETGSDSVTARYNGSQREMRHREFVIGAIKLDCIGTNIT